MKIFCLQRIDKRYNNEGMAPDNWNFFLWVFNIFYRDTVESRTWHDYVSICWYRVGEPLLLSDLLILILIEVISALSSGHLYLWYHGITSCLFGIILFSSSWLFRETWLTQLQHLNGLFSISRWQKNQNANWYFPIFQEFSRINLNLFWLFVECCSCVIIRGFENI